MELYCYSWDHPNEKDPGITYMNIPLFVKVVNKFTKRKYRKVYYNQKVHELSKNKDIDFVICVTTDAVNFFLQHYPEEKIIYWSHNYPERNALPGFLNIVSRKKVTLVTPSLNYYKRMWNEFCPETLAIIYKHIPNFALPAIGNTAESNLLSIQNLHNRLNFIHVSGTAINKGLHIIKKIFFNLCPVQPVNFIYIGTQKQVTEFGNLRIIELPRMSYTDLIGLYKIADFGIMSSIWLETAPLALHEMLENRVIPIITKSGGMEEIVAGMEYLLVENPNDIDEWSTRIEESMKMVPNAIEQMKNSNFEIYSSTKLTMKSWGQMWIALMNTLK